MRLDVREVAKAIGTPAAEWKGRCFEIASRMVSKKLVKGTAIYGHWTGPIARTSFFKDKRHLGFCNHGWVVLEDGETVVDPTRWVFEGRPPYIFVGTKGIECDGFETDDPLDVVCVLCGHVDEEHSRNSSRPCMICMWPYDEGGNALREAMGRPPPDFSRGQGSYRVEKHLSSGAKMVVDNLFRTAKRRKGILDRMQCHWLATQPYDYYAGAAKEIYDALIAEDLPGLIPFDNRQRADREAK